MTKLKWLDRGIFTSTHYYCLCTTKKLFNKELKRLNVAPNTWPDFTSEGCNARIHFFTKESKLLAIITFKPSLEHTPEQIYSLLTHEAVHLWQAIMKEVGEQMPSSEFMAYGIQTLAQRLFEEYNRQTRKKK